jgi:AcrR family transcriptional regulator
MAMQKSSRSTPRQQAKRAQARADRTRELMIEETIRCVREEGFAAASTRRIIERAGLSWGVIQYHFGDRDGLLAAVLDHGMRSLIDNLNAIIDEAAEIKDGHTRAETLTAKVWAVLTAPQSMSMLEILIATRSERGTLNASDLSTLAATWDRLSELLGEGPVPRSAIANLLSSSAVGMMVTQMTTSVPIPMDDEQQAVANVIADRLTPRRRRRPST